MAYPTVDNNHNTEAQALFTDHYRNQVVIPALLKGYMAKVQELETVFWSIINSFLLANNPTGDQLNSIGSIVGAPRGSLNDADYLAAIRLQIRVNRSQGLANDIIAVGSLACGTTGTYHNYVENDPQTATAYQNPLFVHIFTTYNSAIYGASYVVELLQLPSPLIVAGQLAQTRAVGVYGVLHYTTWAPGNDFLFISRYGGKPAGQGAWGSRYTGSVGGNLVAAAVT